jgi:hypothetical protein
VTLLKWETAVENLKTMLLFAAIEPKTGTIVITTLMVSYGETKSQLILSKYSDFTLFLLFRIWIDMNGEHPKTI